MNSDSRRNIKISYMYLPLSTHHIARAEIIGNTSCITLMKLVLLNPDALSRQEAYTTTRFR